ncbi:MAG: hypothetical protein U5K29_06100 [Acidimicrobiales bacterium]|nr:hypothetical protein [Acidimicrobiales bacterium]
MSGVPEVRPTPSRKVLILIATPLVILTIGAYIGDALAPDLVNRNPVLLILLNARNRNLALVTNQLDAVTFYVIGTLRLLLSDPLFYLLGWFYGDAAVKWAERNTKTLGDSLRWVEQHFKQFSLPLVFAFPNNFICLFAGAAGMRPIVFAVANVSGTIARLVAIRVVGAQFSGPIDWLLEFIGTYRIPLLVVSISLAAFTFLNEFRRGGGELTGLTKLPDEMDEGDASPTDPGPATNPHPED